MIKNSQDILAQETVWKGWKGVEVMLGNGCAFILVLFILLVIIACCCGGSGLGAW